jgi:nitroreductase
MAVVSSRKSVRDFSDKEVEEEKLTKILEAARLAPSWANKQCCRYIIVKDKARIQELAAGFNGWLKKAPVVLAACADPKESGSHNGMDYYLVDVGISMQQLILAATDRGLGTCWIGSFDESKVKRILMVPEKIRVVALTPLGYPADASMRTKLMKTDVGMDKRKPLTELIHEEKW